MTCLENSPGQVKDGAAASEWLMPSFINDLAGFTCGWVWTRHDKRPMAESIHQDQRLFFSNLEIASLIYASL